MFGLSLEFTEQKEVPKKSGTGEVHVGEALRKRVQRRNRPYSARGGKKGWGKWSQLSARGSPPPFYQPFPRVPPRRGATECPRDRASASPACSPEAGSLQVFSARAGWSSFMPAGCLSLCPGTTFSSLPCGRAARHPGRVNPNSITRPIPTMQGSTLAAESTVDPTCTGAHQSLS